MDDARLRSWWWERQGLDGSLDGSTPAQVLEAAGWARSVGGVAPYLTLFARAGIGREAADEAAAKRDIHELPAARGCTYVVPADHYAMALRVGQGFGDEGQIAGAIKHLGVTDAEVERLSDEVVVALGDQALDPAGLKKVLGDSVRHLGDEGKKRGVTTTLPLALGRLQSHGRIRRVSITGRLDNQRYRYVRWDDNPLSGSTMTADEARSEVARAYWRWIGPASIRHFRWFTVCSAASAAKAVADLGLVPVADGDDRLAFPHDVKALAAHRPAKKEQVALISSIDSLFLLRRDLAPLIDPGDALRPFSTDHGEAAGAALADLPSHAIVDRGRLIGLWEFDVDDGAIVWATFAAPTDAVVEAVARTEAYVVRDLGDARTFSLDSPARRSSRIDFLRRAAKKGWPAA
jgi:hypothetical protein